MRDRKYGPSQFIRRSVFLKLLLIYLATTLALVVAVSGYNRLVLHNEHFKQTRSKMMAHHLMGMVDEIGHPPDHERAIRLSEELGLQIRLEGPEEVWATDTHLPPTSTLHVHPSQANPDIQTGKYRGRRVVSITRGALRYLFFFPEPPGLDIESLGLLIGLIALILTGSYMAVRWLFRPLDWLSLGVAAIAKGNLTYQIRHRSDDELGQLTGALNNMVTRVREMLRARDRLLVDVSHELSSPLTRIKVSLEFVHDERAREKIQQDVRELEAMVADLLESERLNSEYGNVTPLETDVIPLVHDLVAVYHDQPPGVRVVVAPASLVLKLDAHRFRMALRNVIENALTHTDPARGPVEVWVEKRDDAVRLSVGDHGTGIPADEQALIFEPFYRVDKSRTRTTGGYGLGLSLAKKIMKAHGGDIIVTSDPGRGSTFILTFPLSGAYC